MKTRKKKVVFPTGGKGGSGKTTVTTALGGYSVRNLKYMRSLAEAWPERSIVQQLVAQIPWGHNCIVLDQVKDEATRTFYIQNPSDMLGHGAY